jgi:hypothetical protein
MTESPPIYVDLEQTRRRIAQPRRYVAVHEGTLPTPISHVLSLCRKGFRESPHCTARCPGLVVDITAQLATVRYDAVSLPST